MGIQLDFRLDVLAIVVVCCWRGRYWNRFLVNVDKFIVNAVRTVGVAERWTTGWNV